MKFATFGTNLITHKGEVIGIALGADACAEHECGIHCIRAAFGMDDSLLGIEQGQAQKIPKGKMHWEDDGTEAMLVFNGRYNDDLKDRVLRFWGALELSCAWSGQDFGIRARGAALEPLRKLKAALYKGEAALFLSSTGLMSGLNLVIVDKFPAELNDPWVASQRKARDMRQKWTDTGIEAELRAAGKRWFSLGSRVIEGEGGDLLAWLNPCDQQTYNAGWFSFDDLRQWGSDEGPVVKRG